MKEQLRRLLWSRQGNVATIFALSAPVVLMGIAVAVDFSNASIVHSKLNAAADAASLAALTPAMMQQSDDNARNAAYAMFDARAKEIGSLATGAVTRNVAITHPNGATNRQVDVTYTAQTTSLMGGVFGQSVLTVRGNSLSQATTPPNIDFYLLLDNSPSMALPSTTVGITTMENLTTKQGKCAFACHQASTNNGDTAGNPCADGTLPTLSSGAYCDTSKGHYQIDNYALARKNNIVLRLDELSAGVSKLMQTAKGYHDSGLYATPPAYRFAAYSMDSLWQIGTANTRLMALTSDYVNAWTTASQSFGVMQYYSNDVTCGNAACTTAGNLNDVATNYHVALNDMNNTLPAPGNGTNVSGDKPQELLFFVTDGVEDALISGARIIQTVNGGVGTNYCNSIKTKGVKIAVLYTEYLPVPSNDYYNQKVAPIQNNIGPALQACASPGLYTKVTFGDDIGAALANLFSLATQQAAVSE